MSIPRADQGLPITLERAIELIQAKRTAEANKYIKEFPENPAVKVVNGQYGPYLAVGKRNVKIPKDTDPASLTLEDCLKLAGDDPADAKKLPAKKTATKAGTAVKTPVKKAGTTVKTAAAKTTRSTAETAKPVAKKAAVKKK